MKVLSLCNHKGGAGKTTSAIHFAAALGLCGKRVLVVDLDPQGFLSKTLGIGDAQSQEPASSTGIFFDADMYISEMAPFRLQNFDLIPASPTMTKLMRRLNRPTDIFWVKESLQDLKDYDIVVLDTAAAVTVFSLNALVASDHVVIPVVPEYQPVIGAEQTFHTVTTIRSKLNPDLDFPLFLFTKVDERKGDHEHYRRYLRERYDGQVMSSEIRTNTALSTHYDQASSVFDIDSKSKGAVDYANATDELLHRMHMAAVVE